MANLIYSVIASVDGYIADRDGAFDWAKPDDEVHTFINDLQRRVGTYLYGRRMYDVMVAWENLPRLGDQPAFIQEFARTWQAAEKVVYSKTLDAASSAKTRIERDFDPEAVRQMKTAARDLAIAGPGLAAQAFAANLVDECHLFLAPVVVGGGTPALTGAVRLPLELVDERRFGNGMVYLRYRAATPERFPGES
ncbi:MAG: dihydrofolate reductase family protein [Actinomycetota bacterium]